MPPLILEEVHATPRVHHAARKRGGSVAGDGAGTAARAHAPGRRAYQPLGERYRRPRPRRSLRPRTTAIGLDRGRESAIDRRFTAGDEALVRQYAHELVGLEPNVIVT